MSQRAISRHLEQLRIQWSTLNSQCRLQYTDLNQTYIYRNSILCNCVHSVFCVQNTPRPNNAPCWAGATDSPTSSCARPRPRPPRIFLYLPDGFRSPTTYASRCGRCLPEPIDCLSTLHSPNVNYPPACCTVVVSSRVVCCTGSRTWLCQRHRGCFLV